MAITRFWFFALKPNSTIASPATDPTFLALWAQVLDLCASYTPTPTASTSQVHVAHISTPHPQRPHHFLFSYSSSSLSSSSEEEDSSPQREQGQQQQQQQHDTCAPKNAFVLISTYPSLALCSQADAAYRQKYQPRLAALVDHLALRQMDMEETETIPALLVSASSSSSAQKSKSGGGVTVTLSSRDPLRVEVEGGGGGGDSGAQKKTKSSPSVPPLDEEISGADVYEVPLAPTAPAAVEDGGQEEQKDLFRAQREEGKRWIRISKGWDVEPQDGEVEAFKLTEIISR